jgi:hypothetical protein
VPFHDTEAPMAILLRHVNEQIPSVNSIDPKIDSDISDWIDRMLVKDPTKRVQSANDAWDEFEEIIIGLLGPRWRREARLREGSAQFDTPAPLTPAPFQGTTSDAAVSDEFQSFAWGNAVTPDAPPGPATPPPSESAPVPPEPTVGPPTPAPGPAVAADGTAPATEDGDAGFVTFGAPAAPEAPAEEPAAAEASAPAPAEAETEEAPPAQPTEPSTQPEEDGGFETYIAPAPLRPPTDDAPADAPAIPEPAPDPEPVAAAAPPPPAPAPPAPAPVAPPPQDDLAATVMPSSVTPPPVQEKPKPKEPDKPKPAAKPKERKSGKGALIGFGVAAVIAAIAGFVLGGGGGDSEEGGGAPTAASSNADLEALFPSSWKKISSVPKIPGMQFAAPVALAPGGAAGGESVVVGQVKQGAANSTLLPTGFLEALGLDPGEVPPREAVRLSRSDLQAYRYANLRPRGLDQPVTLFTAPTSEGVATVACVDPGSDCESIANTLKLNAGTPFPVGPSKDYAAGLGKTLGGLDKKVQAGRGDLRGAKTPKAQAAAAKDLSAAYNAAAASVSKLKVSPADAAANQQLAAALKQTGAAYRRLSAAAGAGSKGGYAKARSAVQRGEQSVDGALRGLEAAGYKVAS